MDRTLSWLAGAHNHDAIERTLVEIEAAIAMVALGVANSIRLVNLPGAEDVAFEATARAQAASVAFALQRNRSDSVTLIIGPRLPGARGPIRDQEPAPGGSA